MDVNNLNSNRPVEYDTYKDPVGPLSASAQFLFGAIANFVTGLADVPSDMVTDLVSAGRALGHPSEHYDPHSKWHLHKHRDEHSSSDEDQGTSQIPDLQAERNRGRNEPAEDEDQRMSPIPDLQADRNRGQNEPAEDEETEDEDEEMNSSSGDGQATEFSQAGLSRTRTLQLEKSETMAGDTIMPKRHNIISETASLGSKMSKKFINILIWLPTDLSLSLSKGFHNAPKLYHDPMVKATPKVIGFRSGVRAGGQVRNH